jgi:separase
MDVQTALQQFEYSRRAESIAPANNEHIFLVLDRNVQEIPWESIPILRGRAISRIPSLPFLLDRLPRSIPGGAVDYNILREGVNPRKTFYILNPSGDLAKTQQTFEPWLNDMTEKCGWKGIIGREPTSLEIKSVLQNYDLVL